MLQTIKSNKNHFCLQFFKTFVINLKIFIFKKKITYLSCIFTSIDSDFELYF